MNKILSIVVPCYNEALNIPKLFQELSSIADKDKIEIIFVENGSSDDSRKLFQEYVPRYSWAKLVTIDVNKGYGDGIINGLQSASGEYLGWIHADGQVDFNYIITSLKIIKDSNFSNILFIKGRRKNRDIIESLLSFGMSFVAKIMFKKNFIDINAQPTVFHKSLLEFAKNPPADFLLDFYIYYIALINGFVQKRFDVILKSRNFGKSSWNNGLNSQLKLIKTVLSYFLTLKKTTTN